MKFQLQDISQPKTEFSLLWIFIRISSIDYPKLTVQMLQFLRHITIIFCMTLGLAYSSSVFAAANISVSAKESEDHIFLIFHHDRSIGLNPSFLGNNGRVRGDKAIILTPYKDDIVSRICGSINMNSQYQNIIDFKLKDKYKFLKTIQGEKLVAFKISNPDFKDTGKNVSKDDDKQIDEVKASEATMTDSLKSAAKDTQNSDILVKLTESKNSLQMTFPFSDKSVGAAVFQRGQDLWVAFDSRKDFYIPLNSHIEAAHQYIDPKNTVIKIRLNKDLNAQVLRQGTDWVIKLTSVDVKPQGTLVSVAKSDSLVLITNVKAANNIITIRDQDIGDLLVMVPLMEQKAGVSNARSMVDYKILQSAQGIAVALSSEDVHVSYSSKDQAVEIVSNYKIPSSAGAEVDTRNLQTILPSSTLAVNGDDYLANENTMVRAIVASSDNSSKYTAQINLAEFYFVNSMYHEALGMLDLAAISDPNKSKQLSISFMKAVCMVQTKQNIDARTIFADLKNNYKNSPSIREISLWDRYNEYVVGARTESIGAIEDRNLIAQYSDEFYWPLIIAELDVASNKKDFKLIDQLLSAARKSDDLYLSNNLKFYKAQYYYLQDQNNLAEQLLTEIEAHPASGRDFMMADLQLIKILYEQRKIDWISAVQKLHELRFVWRGGNLELKLLMSLALAYNQNSDVINAIRTYKYVLDAFGKEGNNNFFVTAQIVELYRRIFLSDEMRELDDFTVIALFYEFKDFTPIGSDGDRAVLGIARRMLNLDLLDMAIDILQHQVTYRLRGVDRIITANHLALVYLMDKKPKEALRVMEETDKENINFAEYKQRGELKAKALIDLGKYQAALDYIKDDPSDDATALRLEAYFRANKWSDYIALSEPILKQKMSSGDVIKGDESQDVLRLAISYSMLNRTEDLDYLSQHLMTENKDLKTVVDFLNDTNKPINPHSIDKSLNIDRMKGFVDSQKELLFN